MPALQHVITKRNEILSKNSPFVKKKCAALKKAIVKNKCETQGGGQETAVVVCTYVNSKYFKNDNAGEFGAEF